MSVSRTSGTICVESARPTRHGGEFEFALAFLWVGGMLMLLIIVLLLLLLLPLLYALIRHFFSLLLLLLRTHCGDEKNEHVAKTRK